MLFLIFNKKKSFTIVKLFLVGVDGFEPPTLCL